MVIRETQNILYLNKVAEIGGAEVSLQTLVESLKGSDYRPVVVLGQNGPLYQRLNKLDIKVYVYPLDTCHLNNPIPFLRTILFLRRLIRQEGIKLIHSNTLWDNQYGVISAKLEMIPHILHVRGFSKNQYLWKHFYNLGSMAICNSEYTRKQFINWSGFRKRVEVIYNGIDTTLFKPDPKKREETRNHYGIREVDFVMGMAGRLTEEKGQLPLLKALIPIMRKNRNYKFLVAGDTKIHPEPDYCEQIKTLTEENQLGEQVFLVGFVEDMPAFYNAIDLFLLPSFREPFGRVLVEAMATEKPVIASMVDGVPEIISENSNNGFLINSGDWDSWLQRITYLANNPPLAMDVGREGRKRVEKHFSLAKQTKEIEKIYNSLLC